MAATGKTTEIELRVAIAELVGKMDGLVDAMNRDRTLRKEEREEEKKERAEVRSEIKTLAKDFTDHKSLYNQDKAHIKGAMWVISATAVSVFSLLKWAFANPTKILP